VQHLGADEIKFADFEFDDFEFDFEFDDSESSSGHKTLLILPKISLLGIFTMYNRIYYTYWFNMYNISNYSY